MKNLEKILTTAFLFLVAATSLKTQVLINEYCTANYSDLATWDGNYEDWIEFYNPSGATVDISGYWMSDDPSDIMKWEIPAGTTVFSNDHKMVLISGKGDYDPNYSGYLNTNFKTTQTAGENIIFADPSGTILENYDFENIIPCQANHSRGRSSDGSADWVIFTNPSPDAANSGTTGTAYAATPVFDMQAGYYSSGISVEITSPEPGATIRYTLNGTTPTATSTLYTGPIFLDTTTPLRAIAFSTDATILKSFIETNTYFFGDDQHTIPYVSVTGDQIDGAWGGNELTVIEFFEPDGTFITEGHGDSNEHGNDSNGYPQRGFDYITRDALGYDHEIDHPIFHHSDRTGYERIIFKAGANDNYPFEGQANSNYPGELGGAHIRDAYVHELSILGGLHVDARKTESYVVYLNAEYWGVYDAREKVDDTDYCDFYFDQPEGFVDFIKTWGWTWVEYGDDTDWYDFVDFVLTNDMSVPANYEYVLTQYNTMSLIDYFILNGYVVTTDWLNWNTAWWRGRHPDGEAKRWRYALWDNDATFNHYINYTGVDSTDPDADPCQIENQGDVGGQGHVPVLNALFDNQDFLADYVQRFAALSNTIFSCDQMHASLDSMIAVIAPEMQRQVDRWGGSYAEWEQNVEDMHDFITARCADEIIGGLEDCYDVEAFTLTVVIEGVGEIDINSVLLDQNDVPWTGTFFGDLPIDIMIPGSQCGTFAGWEIISGDGVLADPLNPNTTLTMTSDVTLQATFVEATEEVIVVTDVFPAGAGEITINGSAQSTYPQSNTFGLGGLQNLVVGENEWFEFDHWESQATDFDPNETSTTVSFSSCLSDTLIAVFDEIPHFTLTVLIDGIGEIQINTTTLDELDVPWSDVFEGGVLIDLFTAVSGCGNFAGWEIISGDGVLADPSDPSTTLNMNSDVTIEAMFIDMGTEAIIVTDIFPAGGGEIIINGSEQSTYPQTNNFEIGGLQTLSIEESEWFVFDHWESQYTDFNPNETSTTVTITSCLADTITAVFTEIPHFDLTVDVMPAGAGTITMNGDPLASYPWTGTLEGDLDYYFITTPVDVWSVFDHWEINNHVLSPDEFDTNVILHLMASDSLVAVYTVIEHNTVTVMVDPPYAGVVLFENGLSTTTQITTELEANVPIDFLTSPKEYWTFKGWEAMNSIPSPNNVDSEVVFQFSENDVVIAHFEIDPFSVYLPNSFSPNNDGINDAFFPVLNAFDPESYHLMIFSRWGDKVFDSTDPTKVWDGSHSGDGYYTKDDVYHYRLQLKSAHKAEYLEYTGSILVFR